MSCLLKHMFTSFLGTPSSASATSKKKREQHLKNLKFADSIGRFHWLHEPTDELTFNSDIFMLLAAGASNGSLPAVLAGTAIGIDFVGSGFGLLGSGLAFLLAAP